MSGGCSEIENLLPVKEVSLSVLAKSLAKHGHATPPEVPIQAERKPVLTNTLGDAVRILTFQLMP